MSDEHSNMDDFGNGEMRVNVEYAEPPGRTLGGVVQKKFAQANDGPSQFSHYNGGFVPSRTTTEKLPAGTYKLQFADAVGFYFAPMPLTTDSLLRLPDSKSDAVIAEIERFWTLKEKFQQFGFVHKRGFLLYGPPGSGKTSTVAVVNQNMVAAGGVVLIPTVPPDVLAPMLSSLRQVEPHRPLVVVFEDIDDHIRRYGEAEMLSLLDGESSIDNVVYIATTNYPENLAGRVVNRPSRFDKVIKIGMPNAGAREMYLKSRGLSQETVDAWVPLTDGFSIAHLKELVVGVEVLGEPLDDVVKRLRRMAVTPSSDGDKSSVGFGG
jgi:hypothetical protein